MRNKYLILISAIILIAIIVILGFINNDNETYLKEINYIEYAEKVNNNDSFILYVKQTNCKHCQSFTPKFSNVLEKNKLEAYSLNLTDMETEERNLFISELSVDSTPTVLFFRDGIELGSYSRIEGSKSEEYVVKKLKLNGYIEEEK